MHRLKIWCRSRSSESNRKGCCRWRAVALADCEASLGQRSTFSQVLEWRGSSGYESLSPCQQADLDSNCMQTSLKCHDTYTCVMLRQQSCPAGAPPFPYLVSACVVEHAYSFNRAPETRKAIYTVPYREAI